ncbi:MAG: hypothetical protein Q9212_000630 [Teloschistes hypoglaucus]
MSDVLRSTHHYLREFNVLHVVEVPRLEEWSPGSADNGHAFEARRSISRCNEEAAINRIGSGYWFCCQWPMEVCSIIKAVIGWSNAAKA